LKYQLLFKKCPSVLVIQVDCFFFSLFFSFLFPPSSVHSLSSGVGINCNIMFGVCFLKTCGPSAHTALEGYIKGNFMNCMGIFTSKYSPHKHKTYTLYVRLLFSTTLFGHTYGPSSGGIQVQKEKCYRRGVLCSTFPFFSVKVNLNYFWNICTLSKC